MNKLTKEEVLIACFRKAVDNGYVYPLEYKTGGVLKNKRYYRVIFDPTFCKALWGEPCILCKKYITEHVQGVNLPEHEHVEGWQFHIQQMALAEDRIAYLAEFGGI